MSWGSQKKKKKGIFCTLFCRKEFFLTNVFYLNVQCIKYTFRIYIHLHIKKHYVIHFFVYFQNRRKSSVHP